MESSGRSEARKYLFEFEFFAWEIFLSLRGGEGRFAEPSVTELILRLYKMEVNMKEMKERTKALEAIRTCLLIETGEEISTAEENSFFSTDLAVFASIQNETFHSTMTQEEGEAKDELIRFALAKVHFFCPKSSVDFFESFKVLIFNLNCELGLLEQQENSCESEYSSSPSLRIRLETRKEEVKNELQRLREFLIIEREKEYGEVVTGRWEEQSQVERLIINLRIERVYCGECFHCEYLSGYKLLLCNGT